MSLEGLFALPCTARVTTFFLSPRFYQTTPLRARSLLRAFPPPTPLGALGKPSAVFGSHSLEIFLSPLLPGCSPGGRLQPLPLLFRVRLPPGFSSRRRVGVPRTLSTSPFLSIFFEMFFHFFPRLIQATPVHTDINTHIINEMPFCHNTPSCRVFFLNTSLFSHPTSPPPKGNSAPFRPSTRKAGFPSTLYSLSIASLLSPKKCYPPIRTINRGAANAAPLSAPGNIPASMLFSYFFSLVKSSLPSFSLTTISVPSGKSPSRSLRLSGSRRSC